MKGKVYPIMQVRESREEPATFARRVSSRGGIGADGYIAAKLQSPEAALHTL